MATKTTEQKMLNALKIAEKYVSKIVADETPIPLAARALRIIHDAIEEAEANN